MPEKIFSLVPEQLKVIYEALDEKSLRIRQEAHRVAKVIKDSEHPEVKALVAEADRVRELALHFKVPKNWHK